MVAEWPEHAGLKPTLPQLTRWLAEQPGRIQLSFEHTAQILLAWLSGTERYASSLWPVPFLDVTTWSRILYRASCCPYERFIVLPRLLRSRVQVQRYSIKALLYRSCAYTQEQEWNQDRSPSASSGNLGRKAELPELHMARYVWSSLSKASQVVFQQQLCPRTLQTFRPETSCRQARDHDQKILEWHSLALCWSSQKTQGVPGVSPSLRVSGPLGSKKHVRIETIPVCC